MTKPSVKSLRNKADKLWSQMIRERDGKCRRCGKEPPEVILQAAHVISRRYKAIRWDLRNGIGLCIGCHHWAHKQPVEFDWWVQELLGKETYESLRQEALAYVGRVSRVNLEEVVADLKAQLEEAA